MTTTRGRPGRLSDGRGSDGHPAAGRCRHDPNDLALRPGLVPGRRRPADLQPSVLDQTASTCRRPRSYSYPRWFRDAGLRRNPARGPLTPPSSRPFRGRRIKSDSTPNTGAPKTPFLADLRDPARSPSLARPPARTPAAALLARPRRSQGVEAGHRYRCCPDRAGMAGIDRSSTPHKPAAGNPTD
jgi:hypothetical protein